MKTLISFVLLFFTSVAAADARGQTALEQELAGEMVSIPGGTFRMGDLGGAGWDNEQPVHSVTVPTFNLGRHEVTVGRFRAFVEATGYRTDAEKNADGHAGCFSEQWEGNWDWVPNRSWRDPGYPVAEDQPVTCVSWNDARAFVDWLNETSGGNFRLPSEAEWEYAARAGTTTEYSWGNDIGSNRANCADCGDSWDYAAPVGSFPANPWGLHDMHGNVWEWTEDCVNHNYKGAPTDGSAWTSGTCACREIRGGAWDTHAGNLRSTGRHWGDRADRGINVGFRLAQDE